MIMRLIAVGPAAATVASVILPKMNKQEYTTCRNGTIIMAAEKLDEAIALACDAASVEGKPVSISMEL